jgi:hypothetical protein
MRLKQKQCMARAPRACLADRRVWQARNLASKLLALQE